MQLKGHAHVVNSVEWPAPNTIVSGSQDHSIRLWDLTGGALVESTAMVCCVRTHSVFVHVGNTNIPSWGLVVPCVHVPTPSPPLPQHGNKVVNSVSTAANGVTFASAHPDHIVRVWDSRASGVIAWNRHRHARAVCDIAGCCGRHFCRKAGAARPHGLGFQRCVAARIVQRAGELVVRRVASRVGHPVQHTTAQAGGPRRQGAVCGLAAYGSTGVK